MPSALSYSCNFWYLDYDFTGMEIASKNIFRSKDFILWKKTTWDISFYMKLSFFRFNPQRVLQLLDLFRLLLNPTSGNIY